MNYHKGNGLGFREIGTFGTDSKEISKGHSKVLNYTHWSKTILIAKEK
jgi:hypothetical protein